MKKISFIFTNIFILILSFFVLIIIYGDSFKHEFSGYMYLQVISESMDGDSKDFKIDRLQVDEFILIEKNNNHEFYGKLNIGDVITFKMNAGPMKGKTVTHRIILISYNEYSQDYILTTKGDNNKEGNIEILNSKHDTVYGKVIYSNLFIGKSLNIINNKIFLIIVILIPCLFITMFEVCNIYFTIKYKNKIKDKTKDKGEVQ